MTKKSSAKADTAPLLMTAHEMSKHCGIGENRLRLLMENREIEYLQIGSHRLLCLEAIWDYYRRNKTPATAQVNMPTA